MPTDTQRIEVGDFDGTVGRGLFTWDRFDRIPRTTRVLVHTISLATQPGPGPNGGPGTPLTLLSVFFVRRVQPPLPFTGLDRILLARAADGVIVFPSTNVGDYTLCGRPVPRDYGNPPTEPGEHWRLVVLTEGGAAPMAVHVDWSLEVFPDSDERDGMP